MKTLFVSWQDPSKRRWYPVGRLTYDQSVFRFEYTHGVDDAISFSYFSGMSDLKCVYESEELFPVFANRLLQKARPEYNKLMNWLNIDTDNPDPLLILSLTGGIRKTDSIEIFPCPTPTTDGRYELRFFSRGLSHQPKATQERVSKLKTDEKLYLMKDIQNTFDKYALLLRTDDPVTIVGYCPRYLSKDLTSLLEQNGPEKVEITVDKVNVGAPLQLRLLCKVSSPWPNGFNACSEKQYQPISAFLRSTDTTLK